MASHCIPRRERRPRTAIVALLLAAALAPADCGDDEPGRPKAAAGPVPIEVQAAREIAAALFADGDRMTEARAALEPLLQRQPPDPEDLLRGAAVELELDHPEVAGALLKRAEQLGERSARSHYLAGLHAYRTGSVEAAQKEFERTAELAPDDLPTQLMVAACRMDLGRADAAAPLRKVQAVGPELAGSWYPTALYRLQRLALQSSAPGAADEAQRLRLEYSELQARGVLAATVAEMERGNFGSLTFPAPTPAARAAPLPPAAWQPARLIAPEFAGLTALLAVDLVDDGKIERRDREAVGWAIGAVDLLGFGPAGIVAASPPPDDPAVGSGSGTWRVQRLSSQPVSALAAFDFGQDGDLDFWAVDDGIVLLVADGGKFAPATIALPPLPSPPTDLQVVDFDHEGDLDLLLVGAFGVRLWRDDGAARGGSFTDVTAEAGLAGPGPFAGPFDWCVVDDLDGDQDVDFVLGGGAAGAGAAPIIVADNLRGGRFELRSDRVPANVHAARKPVVADLDGDSKPDFWSGEQNGLPQFDRRRATLGDLNGDGELDLLRWETPAFSAILSLGSRFQTPVDLHAGSDGTAAAAPGEGASTLATALVPLAGAPLPALARLTGRGLELALPAAGTASTPPAAPSPATGLRLALNGRKDNRRGVGAIVELRAGASYQRLFWSGEPQTIGLAGAPRADWVRVTWPNGVIQSEMALPAGHDRIVEQKEGLIGSCPFLYAWNGTTFGFVTDVLGTTPLGLPMRPGELVPPDHDEFVLIQGDQLVARDGSFELQLTEELREVTYLDHARLDVVDHPAAAEIFPNELFTLPPFPEPHVHAVVAPLAPTRAIGSDGRDWTAALRANDFEFAAPFKPYSGVDGQFLGLAPPHHLELEFDPRAIPRTGRLRLVLTGWFYWTDASVNVASSRTPDVEFVPPMLEVPDGKGGWRNSGPPIGFPAGKRKTMVIDVGERLVRADPRIRLSTTLRLYWDSIRLAIDPDDAPLRITPIAAASAQLWSRGFSEARPLAAGPGLERDLEWFDWDRLDPLPRWNQHPGFYTRYGDVRELVTTVDDRFVVMGSGDALTLRFPAAPLAALAPPPAGWTRDYLLYLDGWAKDRDPNTVEALFVEPLPFHGMSGYPYRADEHFPADDAHRRWLLDWQTRPARRWIAPLTARARSSP